MGQREKEAFRAMVDGSLKGRYRKLMSKAAEHTAEKYGRNQVSTSKINAVVKTSTNAVVEDTKDPEERVIIEESSKSMATQIDGLGTDSAKEVLMALGLFLSDVLGHDPEMYEEMEDYTLRRKLRRERDRRKAIKKMMLDKK